MLGNHLRFLYWHAIRYMLYSSLGWKVYVDELFKLNDAATIEFIKNNSWTYSDIVAFNGNLIYSAGTIDITDAAGTVLTTIDMTKANTLDDRFDKRMVDASGDPVDDEWSGFNPDVLEFDNTGTKLHSVVHAAGVAALFKMRPAPNQATSGGVLNVDSVITGTIGVVGSGCDIELDDVQLMKNKIFVIRKLHIKASI